MAEFNLIDEPWIPCMNLHGRSLEYGIQDTLLKAHELREICDDSPLVTVAIHRLLLAILYRAYEGPTDRGKWKHLYRIGRFEADHGIDNYLNSWRNRFDLFDNKHPFMQTAELDLNEYRPDGTVKTDKTDGLMRLAREAPDKGGRILFDHRVGTERPNYEPKQIAKMILSAQAYSGTGVASAGTVGNRKIKPTPCQFAPCVDGLVVWLQGETLFHSLLLNLVPRDCVTDDRPAWEDDSIIDAAVNSWQKSIRFSGPSQRFAPLSRFIRVIGRESMFFTNGLKTVADSEDPMKAYLRPEGRMDYQSVKLREDRAAWRDAHTLFSLDSSAHKPPECLNHAARLLNEGLLSRTEQPTANLVGLATDKGKALLWRHERLPIPLAVLRSLDLVERLGRLIRESEVVREGLSRGLFWNASSKKTIRLEPVGRAQAIADLVLAPSLELKKDGVLRNREGRAPEEAHNKAALDLSASIDPRPSYWARMERHFFDLLDNLSNDWDDETDDWKSDDRQSATNTWRKRVKEEAKRALEESIRSLGTTARAIQAIARVRTVFIENDLKPSAHQESKAARKRKLGAKKK